MYGRWNIIAHHVHTTCLVLSKKWRVLCLPRLCRLFIGPYAYTSCGRPTLKFIERFWFASVRRPDLQLPVLFQLLYLFLYLTRCCVILSFQWHFQQPLELHVGEAFPWSTWKHQGVWRQRHMHARTHACTHALVRMHSRKNKGAYTRTQEKRKQKVHANSRRFFFFFYCFLYFFLFTCLFIYVFIYLFIPVLLVEWQRNSCRVAREGAE